MTRLVLKGRFGMALIACRECGKEVSSSAPTCPTCGFPVARDRRVGALKEIVKAVTKPAAEDVEKSSDGFLVSPTSAEKVFSRMVKGRPPVGLFRGNGVGLHIGRVRPILREQGQIIGIAPLYFTFLFLPIATLSWRVVRCVDGGFEFLGVIDAETCREVFGEKIRDSSAGKDFLSGIVIVAVLIGVFVILAAIRSSWR